MTTNLEPYPSFTHLPAWCRYVLLAVLTLTLLIAELTIGAVEIPVTAILGALAGSPIESVWHNILFEFRLPRALNALVSGAALGAAGLLLQTLFRNPLADPYVLGIVHSARLGAAVLVTFSGVAGHTLLSNLGLAGDVGLALASVAGSTLLLSLLAFISGRVNTITLLISGLMVGYMAVGLISVLLHFVDENQARAFKAWDDASFAGATAAQLRLLIPGVLLGLAALWMLFKPLNALLLGDRYAASMGMPVKRIRRIALFIAAWLCGLVTAYCGPVAFLGLVAAQVARGIIPSADHRLLMPAAVLLGASLGLAADLVTHLPWSRHVLHLNAVIGLVGAPIALYVLLRPHTKP
ncbi:iron ABC transporter permease [Pseudomonas vranovensis]|uniref:Cobalamin ABC transporter permease n=1 Tax=Pseudomonas vranovensis TaxID=321661 RepID=A0A423DGV7_9PSED|nr:iron ABC transporter permease [Pseudomonas vranovensis]ROL70743.1 cobalamin ABC transporter permease [Pseudomonas vranovensis]